MNISVTGSEGFIGRNTTNQLRNLGHEVRTLDRTKEDLFRPETLRDFVSDAQVLIHLAGKNRASDSELYTGNTVSTLGLSQACANYGLNKCTILFASSIQVYEPTSQPIPIDENHKVSTTSAFSNSKLLAENILRKLSESSQINSIVMRMSNVYGPGCKPNYNSVVATFVERASSGKALEVFGGYKARDFIYISDVVDAIIKLAASSAKGFEIFNICTGVPTTINEIALEVKRIFPLTSISSIGEDSPETKKHLIGDPTKTEKAFGFKAKMSIEEGLASTISSEA